MSWSIKLFRFKGIEVKVHLTFVLILIWAAYRWSSGSGAGWQGALFGVVATLLLFAAVTLHEFGHSFQALKYGVKVRDITLMPMGGLARMEEIPEKPAQELRIALAGPLVNFAIAALLIGLGAMLQIRSVISLDELARSIGQISWNGMLAYLTMANLALGIFNLIPAYPMDGGRVLRALLAMRLDYGKATSIAIAVGQGLAWLLGLWGVMNGNWTLVIIAIFVWLGAGQEGKQLDTKNVLRNIRVGEAVTLSPQTLSTDDTLERAVEITLSSAQVDFPVLESGGRLAGLLTEADLLKGLRADGSNSLVTRSMHTQFPTAALHEPLYQVQQRMNESRLQAIPVVDGDGRLVGLLTAADINEAYRLLSASPDLAPAAQ
ncbi:MAG: site-2 protease family protein [Anaerolineales bacterium]|jgi:Zn-dependent protease/CBS domain-containing protein